jgi:hypothetical protein
MVLADSDFRHGSLPVSAVSNSQRMKTYNGSQALTNFSRSSLGENHTGRKKMEYTQQNDQISMYQSNSRAEDGPAARPSLAIYEGVVIPLATLGAALLFVVGAIILTH